ncbi:MAG TPA: gliding motility-associated C-terminal domain-containing protein [Chitinophagales bacterium]|nr:gliding motility-associated C-terminal domain-containing protein [Chitinophagales bacterium]
MSKLFSLIFFFFIYTNLSATHLIGGEMNYRYKGEDEYDISLTVYRDCYLGQAAYDVPAYVLVYDGDGLFLGYFTVQGNPETRLPVEISDECYTAPPNICVERKEYKFTGTLPLNSTGYYLSYQRCCRNNSILNIYDDAVDDVIVSGMNLYTFVPPLEQLENSNPVFNEYPPIAICVNKPFYFDHSATDFEGDSLVYKLCTPTDALDDIQPIFYPFFGNQDPIPFQQVRWRDQYSLENMLGGTEPLKIDSKTGALTALPVTIGQFVVGVCVDEYREGEYIAQTRRDFQFNIGECGKFSTAAFFTYDTICNDLDVSFNNQSIESDSFFWDFGDGTTSNLREPKHLFADYGSYSITLIASSKSGCSDTTKKTIYLLKDNFEFNIKDVKVCKGERAQLTIDAEGLGVKDVQWMFTPSVYTNNLTYTYLPNQSQSVDFVIHKTNGCRYEGKVNVVVDPLPEVAITVNPPIIYANQTVELSTDSDDQYNYLWETKGNNTRPQSASTELFVNQDQWVYLTKTNKTTGCQIKDSVFIKIESCINDADYSIEKVLTKNCTNVELSYTITISNPVLSFKWLVNEDESSSNTIDFNLAYNSNLNFQLVLENGDDCRDTINFEELIPQNVLSIGIPEISTCKESTTVGLYLNIESSVDYQVLWDGEEDALNNQSEIQYSFNGQEMSVPFVVMYNDSCTIEGVALITIDQISVNAQAQPPFVAKGEATVLNAVPDSYLSYQWYPSILVEDSTLASTVAIIEETTDFIVVAKSKNGCIATDTVRVEVKDLRCGEDNIFIPTAFTPNGDGINDVWKVRTAIAEGFTVQIYNRWGELVFESNDLERGWDGVFQGKPSESGSYAYYLTVVCQNEEQYFAKGNITLIR